MKERTRRFTGKVEFERDSMCVSSFPLGRKGKQIVSNPSPLPMVDIHNPPEKILAQPEGGLISLESTSPWVYQQPNQLQWTEIGSQDTPYLPALNRDGKCFRTDTFLIKCYISVAGLWSCLRDGFKCLWMNEWMSEWEEGCPEEKPGSWTWLCASWEQQLGHENERKGRKDLILDA